MGFFFCPEIVGGRCKKYQHHTLTDYIETRYIGVGVVLSN